VIFMPPLAIEFSPRFRASARALPSPQQQEVAEVVASLREAFGHPHRHSGLGIRRLGGAVFECRIGRDLRVVFELSGGCASLILVGTHNEVRRYLKNR
jgi:mRNA-degrading endonuclease RelE of RelBE toxin-antitoxin system